MAPEIGRCSHGLLELVVSTHEQALKISLRGELDLANVELADAYLRQAEADETRREIIVDIEELHYIDSTGVGWLVDAWRRSRADSNRLRVTSGTPEVERILSLTGLSTQLPRA
jgi:anti-sigma B factor antagonist